MKVANILIVWLSGLIPFSVWASLPSQHQVSEARTVRANWDNLFKKLVNGRMPKIYYDFLVSKGIIALEQLNNLDEETKIQLLQMYKDDLIIIAGGSSGIRSFE